LPRDNRAPPVKLYYRIGEVAALVGVEPHVLRYWESEFPTIRPQKSRSGQRVYSRRDVEKLLRVKDLLYAQRFTIAGARQRLRASVGEMPTSVATSPEPATEGHRRNAPARVESDAAEWPVDGEVTLIDGAKAASAALRSALLAVREQVVELLDQIDGGERQSGSPPSRRSVV
jgi:DNA-binding transcriptional MerR regulator